MPKKILILVTAGFLLSFSAGYILGVKWPAEFFGAKGQSEILISDLKGSELLRSANLAVFGEVASISSRDLTLKEGEDEFTFSVKEGVAVLRLPGTPTTPGAPSPEEIKFEDIKAGEKANLTLSLDVGGKFEVTSVVIFFEP